MSENGHKPLWPKVVTWAIVQSALLAYLPLVDRILQSFDWFSGIPAMPHDRVPAILTGAGLALLALVAQAALVVPLRKPMPLSSRRWPLALALATGFWWVTAAVFVLPNLAFSHATEQPGFLIAHSGVLGIFLVALVAGLHRPEPREDIASRYAALTLTLCILLFLVSVPTTRPSEAIGAGLLLLVPAVSSAGVILLARTLAGRQAHWHASHCPRCGYDIATIESDRCPECGGSIIPTGTDPQTHPS